MRECIYCGRSLEKGEKCDCAMSVARRMEKEKNSAEAPKGAKKEEREKKKREKAEQKREKKENDSRARAQAKARARERFTMSSEGVFRELWRHFISFVKSPIETVMNPGEMSQAVILLFAAFEGLIGGLCVYSVFFGAARGAFRYMAYMMGLGGMKGFATIRGFILAAISGVFSGGIIFFVYSGIFYLVNRWVFKQFTPYWEFAKRFAFVGLPISIIGAVGVVLGIFSQVTFTSLLICSIVGSLIITYEILRSVWYNKSTTTIMYTMMICIFVFITILMTFIRFA